MRAPLGGAAAGLALLCAKIALADAPGDLEARLHVDDGLCFHAATLARSDTHVYWARGSKVLRAPKTGGPAEVVFDLGDANTPPF